MADEPRQRPARPLVGYRDVGEHDQRHTREAHMPKRFKAVVSLSGISYGSGAGRSKKEAEQAAARVAVERLRSGALQKPVAAEQEEM